MAPVASQHAVGGCHFGIPVAGVLDAPLLPVGDGESVDLEMERTPPVAARFDAATIKEALREAQCLAPGYTYKGFCTQGCSTLCTESRMQQVSAN